MKINQLRTYGAAGGSDRLGEITLHVRASDCDTVAQADSLFRAAPDMLEMLYKVFPIVEDAESDPCYKPGVMAKIAKDIRALIDQAEGNNHG
jgi:hypothetical protein